MAAKDENPKNVKVYEGSSSPCNGEYYCKSTSPYVTAIFNVVVTVSFLKSQALCQCNRTAQIALGINGLP